LAESAEGTAGRAGTTGAASGGEPGAAQEAEPSQARQHSAFESLLQKLPGVRKPIGRLSFKQRMKWTAIILILYFVLSDVFVIGIDRTQILHFEQLAALFGARFGTLMTLGIGPIVTASIIIQLLVGSRLINWDLNTSRGRILFQGTQKLMTFAFSFIEAAGYALFGGVAPSPFTFENVLFVVLQLAAGGILVIFMDEVVSKWGFGSGVSLFILAGVSKQIFISAFGFLPAEQGIELTGRVLIGEVLPVVSTLAVFALAVYAQSMKIEIPLAFGMFRGFGRKWPLKFIYTSNMPVILTAALLVNLRIWAQLSGNPIIGEVQGGQIVGGLAYFLTPPNSYPLQVFSLIVGVAVLAGLLVAQYIVKAHAGKIILASIAGGSAAGVYALTAFPIGAPLPIDVARAAVYTLFFIVFSVIFSIFWVNTAGMDSRAVAKQIQRAGLQIPGFRRDPRVIEHVLDRYIPSLTVLGGAFVGFLAAFADFTNALAAGTSILLAVMIVYQLYEQLAYQHLQDMHPAIRRFFEAA